MAISSSASAKDALTGIPGRPARAASARRYPIASPARGLERDPRPTISEACWLSSPSFGEGAETSQQAKAVVLSPAADELSVPNDRDEEPRVADLESRRPSANLSRTSSSPPPRAVPLWISASARRRSPGRQTHAVSHTRVVSESSRTSTSSQPPVGPRPISVPAKIRAGLRTDPLSRSPRGRRLRHRP